MESLKTKMDKYAFDILNTDGHVEKQRLDDFLNGANFVIRKIEGALEACKAYGYNTSIIQMMIEQLKA